MKACKKEHIQTKRSKFIKRVSMLLTCCLLLSLFSGFAFAQTPVASGTVGAGGASWTLYDNGTVVVGGGTINWNISASPWDAHRTAVRRIEFTAPIVAGANLQSLFRSLPELTHIINLDFIDTSSVINMNAMFFDSRNITTLDVSSWDTGNVTDMTGMFFGARSIVSLDVSNWNTSNVTNMTNLFQSTYSLVDLDVSQWDTSNVQLMSGVFFNATSLTELDVSNWNTGNVTNMQALFARTDSLTELDVSNWDTSSVTNMVAVFQHTILSEIDVSNWDTSNVTNMSGMFAFTDNLTSLDISNWNTSGVTHTESMFTGTGLTELDLSGLNTSSLTNMSTMFWNASLITLDVSDWDTSNVANMQAAFFDASSLTALDLSSWNTGNVATMHSMFFGTTSLRELTLGEDFQFIGDTGLPEPPNNATYTGLWTNVGTGTTTNPQGTHQFTSAQMIAHHNANPIVETWIWQRTPNRTIIFLPGGTSVTGMPLNRTVALGETIYTDGGSIATPSRAGYTFNGWTQTIPSGASNLSSSAVAQIVVSEDMTFLAQWTPAGGGTPPPPPPPPPPHETHLAYMLGYPDSSFRPNTSITRAEAATILARTHILDFEHDISSLPDGMTSFNVFADVTPNDWFYYYLAWVYHDGLINGDPIGTSGVRYFRPNDPITREEFAAMFARTGEVLPTGETSFADADDISDWAKQYMYTVYRSAWMVGDDNGNVHPGDNIIRAEVATVINRVLGRIDSRASFYATDLRNIEHARDFPDVSLTAWYFPSVVAATNDHRLTRNNTGVINWMYILSDEF